MTNNENTLPSIIITVEIEGEIIKRNLSDDLKVSEEHINEYLIRAPGLTAYWNTLYERQRLNTQRAKVALERKRALLDKQIRTMIRADSKKAVNAEVESAIICHPEYIEAEEKYLKQREAELTLKGAVEAIKEHRSSLISLAANMRSVGSIGVKNIEAEYRGKFNKK